MGTLQIGDLDLVITFGGKKAMQKAKGDSDGWCNVTSKVGLDS